MNLTGERGYARLGQRPVLTGRPLLGLLAAGGTAERWYVAFRRPTAGSALAAGFPGCFFGGSSPAVRRTSLSLARTVSALADRYGSSFLSSRYAIVTRSRATATTATLWVWGFRSRRKNAPIGPGCVAACWAPA